MIARLIGFGFVALGVALVRRARVVNDWTFRINADLFGWEPGRVLRWYGLALAVGIGLVLSLMGMMLLVAGADALGN